MSMIARIAPRVALVLLPVGITACEPVYGDPYYDSYDGYGYPSGVYSDRIYADRIYNPYDYPREVYRAGGRVFPSAAARDAYLSGLSAGERRAELEAERLRQIREADLAAQQRARREARLDRQHDSHRRAGRDYRRADWDYERAERELRREEWRDRRPVGTDRYDRYDAERRDAQLEARRARIERERSERLLERERARLERERQAANAQERIERLTRAQQRQEARERQARRRAYEEEDGYYRRQGQGNAPSPYAQQRMDQAK